MTWSGAITVLEAHLATSVTGYSFAIIGGDPGVPARKTVFWAYAGSQDNELIGETLTDHPFSERITVGYLWPVATRQGVTRELEMEVRQVTRALIAALEGDRKLGGNVEALTIGEAVTGWLTTDAFVRTSTITLDLGFTDVEPIAE